MIHSRPFRSYAIACMLAVVATPASFAGSMAGEIHNAQQCFDYHYYNLRAVMSSDIKKAISKIQLNRAAVADFRRLKDELETEMRYLGLDVTKDSILSISQLAKGIEATANLTNNLLELHPAYQIQKKANPVYSITLAELRKANGTVRKEKRQRKVTGLDGKYLSTAIKSLEESLPKGQSFLGVLARSARELAQDVDDLSVMTKKHAALKADVQGELNRIDRQITEFENKTQQSHEFLSMYEDLENALADYCAEAIEPEEDQNSRTSEADKSPNDFNEMLKDLNRAKKNEVALPPEATFDPQQAQPDLAAEFERKKREFLARGPRNRPIVTSPQAIPKQHSSSSTLVGDILGGFAQGVLIGAQIMSAVPQRGRTPVPTYTSPVIIPPSSNQRPLIPCKEWYQNTLAKGKNPPSLASVCPGQ